MSGPIILVQYGVEDYDVYVGRPSIYGNPFVIGADGTRDEVILKFEMHFRRLGLAEMKRRLDALRGKRIACPCNGAFNGKGCHALSLLRMASEV